MDSTPPTTPPRTPPSPGTATTTAAPPTDAELAATLKARWLADPVIFAWEALGLRLWKKQRAMVRAMARNLNVAVRSGQKTGKTAALVVYALWQILLHDKARVFVTSSDYRNVKKVFWHELRTIVRGARVALGGKLNDDPQAGYTLPNGNGILGFSADRVEGWGGYSGANNAFILDEASAISQPIFEAIDGNRQGGGTLIMAGNPTQNAGPFFNAFHSQRQHWVRLAVSSLETPNCTGEEPPCPGLADLAHCQERERRYGAENPFYIVRVLGDFAPNSDDAIVPLGLVEAAQTNWAKKAANGRWLVLGRGRLTIGVDPARYGADDTAMCCRRGRRVLEHKAAHGQDSQGIVGAIRDAVLRYTRPDDDELPLVNVDCTGGYGNGVVDLLKELKKPNGHPLVEIVEVNSSATADDEDTYTNMRTQLLFGVRTWLEEGPCAIPWAPATQVADDELAADLVATKYTFDARGRRKAERKEDVKALIGRSPDKGDALALSLYTGGSPIHTGTGAGGGGFHAYGDIEDRVA